MNLVQRMVAENLQSVTSQELAEEFGVSHADFWTWLQKHKKHFEHYGPLQQTLNASQMLLACGMNPYDTDIAWELAKSANRVLLTCKHAHLQRY